MSIHRKISIGMIAFLATMSLQSCDPVSSEKEQAKSPCFIALRAQGSACAEPGGSTNQSVQPVQPAATRYFDGSIRIADTSRVPDSVLVISGGQVATSERPGYDRTNSKLALKATFDQAVQVPDTVYVLAFVKSVKFATIKFLNQSTGWTVVSIDRDTVQQVATSSDPGPTF